MLFYRVFPFVLLLFLTSIATAKDKYNYASLKPNQFVLFDGKKYVPFDTFEHQRMIFSSKCGSIKKLNSKCLAFSATTQSLSDKESSFNGSPASELCTTLKGVNLVAFDHTGGEQNFCKFTDDSMVNSWSLYYHYFPKTEIK